MIRRSTAIGYLTACLSTVAVAAFRFGIGDFAGDQITLLPFLLSVAIAARYGGFGPGLVATVLGAVASVILFAPHTQTFFLGGTTDRVRLCVYVLIGTTISYLYAALIAARARAEANALEAIEKQRRLVDADRNKNEFLATLAHEMRNPLAALQNQVAVLQREQLHDGLQTALDLMQRQTSTLGNLTGDLLDLSAISRGKVRLKLRRTELNETIKLAIDTIRPTLESHHHSLEVALPEQSVFIIGDASRLTQVFVNLLKNSVKYTDNGGKILISAVDGGREAIVRVVDNGIGLSTDHLPRLFELGEQVEKDIERSDGGLGIGLAVVRRLVEMHGGAVAAASDGPGLGCSFTVRLPIARQNVGDELPANSNRETGENRRGRHCSLPNDVAAPRILVVDDHGSIAKTCALILRDYGCETQSATDGKVAVQFTHDFHPDILLIDLNMPDMNGYELARLIKNTPQGKKATLVAMTGSDGERELQRCIEAGYTRCLEKPLGVNDLHSIVDDWMKRSDCQGNLPVGALGASDGEHD